MALFLISPPAIEPVTLAEAKAHLRLDATDEDTYVQALIVSARVRIEVETRRALINQSWMQTLDCWPDGDVVLRIAPVGAVSSVTVKDTNGVAQTVDPSLYTLVAGQDPQRLALTSAVALPGIARQGIAITTIAGYGATADDVPADIRQAHLLLIADWFEHRDPLFGASDAARLPKPAAAILNTYRATRL